MTDSRSPDASSAVPPWHKTRMTAFILLMHLVAAALLGLSASPALALVYKIWVSTRGWALVVRLIVVSLSTGVAYFAFGLTLVAAASAVRALLRLRLKPGEYGVFSTGTLRWIGYNTLLLLVHEAFLDVLRLSPIQTWFYRAMGAAIGQHILINTSGISDVCLLEIGDEVVIGGGATVICHSMERGVLKLVPVKIGRQATIGLNAVILPGVEIGERAVIAACALLLKGTKVPPGTVWVGNPARQVGLRPNRSAPVEVDVEQVE